MELLKSDDIQMPLLTELEPQGLRNYDNIYENLEKNSQEYKFILYKMQNIIAVVAVLLLIIMDIFQLRVYGVGATEVFTQMQSSLWKDMFLPLIQQFFRG